MKPCDLCGKSVDEDEVELVSYYDLGDLGLALGYSITLPVGEMDLSRVIPGCKRVPDDKSFKGNLATWEVCDDCHRRIRRFLKGRSEYPPRHY